MAIEAFQICCLLLPPENRRKLQLLMRMMARICLNKEMPPLCDGFGTRTLVGWYLTSKRIGVWEIKFTRVKFTSLATRGKYKAGCLKEPWLEIRSGWYYSFGLSDLKNICCSVPSSCPTLCDPMDCSMPGFPCPSLSPGVCSNSCPLSWQCYLTILSSDVHFSFAFNLFQHQGLFQWVSSSHQVAKVLKNVMRSKEWVGLDSECRDSCILPAVNTKRRTCGQERSLASQETTFSPSGQKGLQSRC